MTVYLDRSWYFHSQFNKISLIEEFNVLQEICPKYGYHVMIDIRTWCIKAKFVYKRSFIQLLIKYF